MRQEQYFLDMIEDIKTWIPEALHPPTEVQTEETTARHNVGKLLKTNPKNKIVKVGRKKCIIFKEAIARLRDLLFSRSNRWEKTIACH